MQVNDANLYGKLCSLQRGEVQFAIEPEKSVPQHGLWRRLMEAIGGDYSGESRQRIREAGARNPSKPDNPHWPGGQRWTTHQIQSLDLPVQTLEGQRPYEHDFHWESDRLEHEYDKASELRRRGKPVMSEEEEKELWRALWQAMKEEEGM